MRSREWEQGYLEALQDVKRRAMDLVDWVSDLAMAIIEDLPEGDGDAETRRE